MLRMFRNYYISFISRKLLIYFPPFSTETPTNDSKPKVVSSQIDIQESGRIGKYLIIHSLMILIKFDFELILNWTNGNEID